MNVSIELTDNQVESIIKAFRRGRLDTEETATQLVNLAIASWTDWLSGSERYSSLTQQYTDWIEDIYINLLPEDEQPSVDRLYNYFNIPYGQAQYIARVLSNKSLTYWRERAVEKLKAAMEEKFAEVDKWINHKEFDLMAEIIIDKLSYLELKSTFERLFQTDPHSVVPPEVRSAGNLYSVQIQAGCFRKVYDAIEY